MSCLVQLKPRRVVVVNARSATKFDYTMMDMDDTKYVQPHNPFPLLCLAPTLYQSPRNSSIHAPL